MAKLSDLLAVQANLKGQAHKKMTDVRATFKSRRHLFEETHKTFQPSVEGVSMALEATTEEKDIQATVIDEVGWLCKAVAKSIDIGYQVDVANLAAKADLITEDGETLLKDVPATALLQLDHRVKELKDFIETIPTLDPAKGFRPDPSRGAGFYVAREIRKDKTQKTDRVIVLAPATDKHPAQVTLKPVDAHVGHILEQEWSSLITPATKSALLDQVEIVLRAIKEARSRANGDIQIKQQDHKIGNVMLDFVFKPLYEQPVA